MKAPLSLLATLFALPLLAQTVPTTLNYQGRLTDNSPGQTPLTATIDMQFAIYDAPGGGTRLWQEPAVDATGVPVSVTGGIFNYALGATVAIPAAVFTGATSERYLQITLNPAGSAEILAPRQRLSAGAYANLAQKANAADTATTAMSASFAGSATTATTATNFTGALAGDVTGTQGATVVGSLQGQAVAATSPAADQVLQYSGGQWQPATLAFSYTETDPKVGTLTAGRVPYWGAASLVNGSLFDTGSALGVNTTAPISPLHVAGRTPALSGATATNNGPMSVHVQGNYAYVANYLGASVQIIDLSNPAAPQQVGGIGALGGPYAIHVQGRYAYIADYTGARLRIIDVSNPFAPVSAGFVGTGLQPQSVYVQGRYAYLGNRSTSRLYVYDVSNPAAPVLAGSVGTFYAPRSIYVQGRYAYLAYYITGELGIFDISNPAAPTPVSSVDVGSSADSIKVQGRYAYLTDDLDNRLRVVDVSNPAAPSLAGWVATSGVPQAVHVQGRYAYTVSQSPNVLQVFDVANPAAPALALQVALGANSFATSLHVQGRHAYVTGATGNLLEVYDLGGAYLQQLETGGLLAGTLAVRGDAHLGNNADLRGGLVVGSGGILSSGSVAAPLFVGALAGNASTATAATSATSAASATNFTGALAGDVTGTQGATAIANDPGAGTRIVAAIGNAGATGTIPAARLPAMGGATGVAAGSAGLVPAPAAGQQGQFLRGDATWAPAFAWCLFSDVKTVATQGGTFTGGSWQVRTLNTAVTATGCSLALNQIILAPGTYLIRASAPAYRAGSHQLRLFNVTAGAVAGYGTVEYGDAAALVQTRSTLSVSLTLTVTTTLQLEHQASVTRTVDGLGRAAGFLGGGEIYTQVEIFRQ